MAKSRILAMTMPFLIMAATLMIMASQANALMPYTRSPPFDILLPMTEDTFRVLEQTPLTIPKGADHHQTGRLKEKWRRAERTFGKFWRQFRMPVSADLEHVKAHLENGVLRITVPKPAEEKKRQPKVININEEPDNSSGEDIKAAKAQM